MALAPLIKLTPEVVQFLKSMAATKNGNQFFVPFVFKASGPETELHFESKLISDLSKEERLEWEIDKPEQPLLTAIEIRYIRRMLASRPNAPWYDAIKRKLVKEEERITGKPSEPLFSKPNCKSGKCNR